MLAPVGFAPLPLSAPGGYINTAIVVKNIPFALQRDDLIHHIISLGLPSPVALNYHLDNGTFRGLCFANFRTPQETELVMSILNGHEIDGRRLRVEYKKIQP
ncbi:hypothetical protein GQ42DRAFT_117962, partial [Ramicandelaber brevisporus]